MRRVGLLPIICATALVLSSCTAPRALFEAPLKTAKAGEWMSFTNLSKNAEIYSWDFGDGTTSTDAAPQHRFWESGRYTVSLTASAEGKSTTKSMDVQITAPDKCLVLLKTDMGDMILELYDDTPYHRDNFVKLVEEDFYEELLFHRVIPNFMVQGGDPQSKHSKANQPLGRGGPGYTLPAEILSNHIHVKGALAAARLPDAANPEKNSSGSQFYIVHGKQLDERHLQLLQDSRGLSYSQEQIEAYLAHGGTPHLDGDYTVFGHVLEGLDIIDKIAGVKRNRRDRPDEDLKMSMLLIK